MSQRLWIDTHVHVSAYDRAGSARDHLVADLLAVLEADGADLRWVLSPDGVEMGRIGHEAEGIADAASFIHSLTQQAPGRFYGSCMVNPNFLDASLQAMEQCFGQWGFVQLGEFLGYAFGFDLNSAATETLVRRAVEFAVPVQAHISTSNREEHPSSHGMDQLEDLLGLVERVPEAQYILAHLVGMPDDNPPVVDAYLDRLDRLSSVWLDNLWVEIRDFDSPGVASVLQRVPAERLLAGTDWTNRIGPPYQPYGTVFGVQDVAELAYRPGVASMAGFLREAGATEEQIELIGSGNAQRLLRI